MRVIFAAGGTAGHIKPALVVARRLRERQGAKIAFVGHNRGLEVWMVPEAGFPLFQVSATGWRRGGARGNLLTLGRMSWGVFQALALLARFRPQVVVGMGGFVSVPVVVAARIMGIPVLLHEQNAWPGLANRRLARWARVVAVPFADMEHYFPGARRVTRTGTPVEPELITLDRTGAREKLAMPRNGFLLVAFGGSRGAGPINEAMLPAVPRLLQESGVHLVWITGEAEYEPLKQRLEPLLPAGHAEGRLQMDGYRRDMPVLLAAADLVLCRAGATTLAELTARGVPAVLVPSSYVVDDHQEKNARRLEKEGAGLVLGEEELTPENLLGSVLDLRKDPKRLQEMAECSYALGVRQAAEELEDLVTNLATGEGDTVLTGEEKANGLRQGEG